MQDFLNWRTDPLLVDPEPLIPNTWLATNDIIESGQREKIFTANAQFQLYSFMIRKNDFVSGERILQSFPYILLDTNIVTVIRKHSLALAEKAHHYFLNSNYNKSIRIWQQKIISYLEEQQRIPFPLFRLFPSWERFFQGKQYIQFQSARGEGFQLPLFLTEDIAYLVGVIMGDGHLAEYFINIIDNSKEHIENLEKLLEENFQSNIEFFPQKNAQAWNINILGKWIVRFFNFLSGQPINERKYPSLCEPFLFQTDKVMRCAFWRGLMDADGSYKSTILFGSASRRLITDFETFLQQHNITFQNYQQEVFGGITYSVSILGRSRKDFTDLVGTAHPQKQAEIKTILARKINRFSPRPHTLLKEGFWKGQVLAFKEDKLLDGFFDYTKLPHISIRGLGGFLKTLRGTQTQKELAKNFRITQSLVSQYERNATAIPISFLKRFFIQTNYSFQRFFTENQKLTFQSTNSTCVLDTQPNDVLLTMLQGIQLNKNNYFFFIGKQNQLLKDYKKRFCNYFSLPIPKGRRFYNTVLYSFVKEFFHLKV